MYTARRNSARTLSPHAKRSPSDMSVLLLLLLPDKAAVALQIFATCCCSFAFAMLVVSAIAPKKVREASFVWSTYLGEMGGCFLVLYALTQLVVLCMVSGFRNRCEQIDIFPAGGRGFFCSPVRCWRPGRSMYHTCRGERPCRQRTSRGTEGTRSLIILKSSQKQRWLFFSCAFGIAVNKRGSVRWQS